MNFLGAIILVVLFLLAVFSMANWAVLTAPTALSFIVFHVEAPLGASLLGVMLALVALFTLYVLTLRTTMLMESRRHKQELQAQRKLAESAEASRLNVLREQMERDTAQLRGAIEQGGVRMDGLERSLQRSFDETANGLAANIGEVENKLDRVLARAAD